MTEDEQAHEIKKAQIEARKYAFEKNPKAFIIWDRIGTALNILFWLGLWLIVAQCQCKCFIK